MDIALYNTKILSFPDGTKKITKYAQPKSITFGRKKSVGGNRKETTENENYSTLYRLKTKIKNYALSNSFDTFWTLTFDPQKVDSFNYSESKIAVQKWIRYMRDKYGKFDFIFIPELHPTSGRVHWHGLTLGLFPEKTKARGKNSGLIKGKSGVQIYTCDDYILGWSTLSQIDDSKKTAHYITKYITKELGEVRREPYEPRYLNSRGLKYPSLDYQMVDELVDRETGEILEPIWDNTQYDNEPETDEIGSPMKILKKATLFVYHIKETIHIFKYKNTERRE